MSSPGPRRAEKRSVFRLLDQAKNARKAVTFLKKWRPARGNQKTFDSLRALTPTSPKPPISKSFLLLFFKKEVLPSFLSGQAA
jgi:hypothetical protein